MNLRRNWFLACSRIEFSTFKDGRYVVFVICMRHCRFLLFCVLEIQFKWMKKVQAGALDGLGKMRRWSALTTLIELNDQKYFKYFYILHKKINGNTAVTICYVLNMCNRRTKMFAHIFRFTLPCLIKWIQQKFPIIWEK